VSDPALGVPNPERRVFNTEVGVSHPTYGVSNTVYGVSNPMHGVSNTGWTGLGGGHGVGLLRGRLLDGTRVEMKLSKLNPMDRSS